MRFMRLWSDRGGLMVRFWRVEAGYLRQPSSVSWLSPVIKVKRLYVGWWRRWAR